MHYFMVLSRLMDEQMIRLFKKGQGHFWIGAPGEEALGTALGMLVKKGQGLKYDWLHLHYRCTGTVLAMGLDTKQALRFMINKKTEPFTGGRNFVHHYSIPEWNIPPVSSVVEIQHSLAIGTAYAQTKEKTEGAVTIVTGGDAGTALPDFSSSLIWASRPTAPLPLLIIVLNNRKGISTNYESQHSEKYITDRAKAFGIETCNVDGNNAVESYQALEQSFQYVRETRKPLVLEAEVSRIYGHSSSSGAAYEPSEVCCLKNFEDYLIKNKILNKEKAAEIRKQIFEKLKNESSQVLQEEDNLEPSVWDFVYRDPSTSNWRNF